MSETLVQEPDFSLIIRKKWLRAWLINSSLTAIYALALVYGEVFDFFHRSAPIITSVLTVLTYYILSIALPYWLGFQSRGTRYLFLMLVTMSVTTFIGLTYISNWHYGLVENHSYYWMALMAILILRIPFKIWFWRNSNLLYHDNLTRGRLILL